MSFAGHHLGHYHLQQVIGSGGMGEVYLAEDSRLRRQVAIKMVRNEAGGYPYDESMAETLRLFEREARAIARLDHPHILPLYEYGNETIEGATVSYLVMPYRAEGSLAQWVGKHRPSLLLTPIEVLPLVEQASSALQYAHDNDIIHQDVKPANFLLRHNQGHPARPDLLLSDFGVAKLSTGTSNASQSIRGTPSYMAPEQWSGIPTPATDQYALAIMTYELLTGRLPFQGAPMQLMYYHLHESPLPPSSINPRLSSVVDTVLLSALAKRPADRFTSIAAFFQALQKAMLQIAPNTGGEDLHVTLAISSDEALTGAQRTLRLPGGRQVTITIPANSRNGQVLRLDGLGETPPLRGQTGALLLRLAISDDQKETVPISLPNDGEKTLPTSDPHIRHQPASLPQQHSFSGKSLLVVLAMITVLTSGSLFYFLEIRTNGAGSVNTHVSTVTSVHQTSAPGTSRPTYASTSQATSPIVATSTNVDATTNPYPPYSGTLVLNDTLISNSASEWQVLGDTYGACAFENNTYHIRYSRPDYYLFCTAQTTNFSNFAYQVQMALVNGDMGGIVFRVDVATNTKFYYFHINTSGQYGLDLYVDNTRKHAISLADGYSSVIHTSLFQINTLAVVAIGKQFDLYVNDTLLTATVDSANTYSQGQVGLIADSLDTPTEAIFSNAKVWAL